MSVEEKIINEIENLTKKEKVRVLEKIKEKYFNDKNEFIVGENYDFWLNEKDEEYESEV